VSGSTKPILIGPPAGAAAPEAPRAGLALALLGAGLVAAEPVVAGALALDVPLDDAAAKLGLAGAAGGAPPHADRVTAKAAVNRARTDNRLRIGDICLPTVCADRTLRVASCQAADGALLVDRWSLPRSPKAWGHNSLVV